MASSWNKLSHKEVVTRIKNIHGNNFDTSKIVYVNSKTKVLIGCKNHDSTFWYKTTPGPLFKGVGCPKCGTKKIWEKRGKITTKEFIKKAKKKHGNKYSYSKSIYIKSRLKLTVICKIHGEWEITPNNHLRGNGCEKCGHNRSSKKRAKGLDYFLIKSKTYFGEKYNYDYINYKDSRTKVKIICPIHGEFFQTMESHSNGRECIKCSYVNRGLNHPKKLSLKVFIERCKDIWLDSYDFSKIKEIKNINTKVKVRCKDHGEFLVAPRQLLNGSGCYQCGLEKLSELRRIDYDEFTEIKKDIWGEKYEVKEEDYFSYQSFKVYCKKHEYLWTSNGSAFLKGHGCRKCGFGNSKGETGIFEILKTNKINFIEQHKFFGMKSKRSLRCDFYLPEYNLVIEYNGEQHYKPIDFFGGLEGFNETKKRDLLKKQYCIENNIYFEEIRFDDVIKKRMKEILIKYSKI